MHNNYVYTLSYNIYIRTFNTESMYIIIMYVETVWLTLASFTSMVKGHHLN